MSIPTLKAGMLGKLPVKAHPNTLSLDKYLTPILPFLRSSVAWERKVTNWSMLGNDQYGDCVEAAAGNTIMTMTSQSGIEYSPTTNQILQDYTNITGFDPNNPSSDNGTVMVDALAYYVKTGIVGRKILGWASVKIDSSLWEFKQAISLFGTVLTGFNFPQSAMDQFNAGQPWRIDTASPIVGGHCIAVSEYDATQLVGNTWGALQPMSLGFLPYYADEAYVIITQDWINQMKKLSVSGFNINVLENDAKVLIN
jgi:hypothetical protein